MIQIEELKSNGLKATVPRMKILEVFQRGAVSYTHLTLPTTSRV